MSSTISLHFTIKSHFFFESLGIKQRRFSHPTRSISKDNDVLAEYLNNSSNGKLLLNILELERAAHKKDLELKEKDNILELREKDSILELKEKDLLLKQKELELKEKDLQLNEKDKEKEIYTITMSAELDRVKLESQMEITKIHLSKVQIEFLQLKGRVHARGSFERFEETFLGYRGENRKLRWKKYLQENELMAGKFRKALNCKENDFVVIQVASLYSSLSERIHKANHIASEIEWRFEDFGEGWTRMLIIMCEAIVVPFKIIKVDKEGNVTEISDEKDL